MEFDLIMDAELLLDSDLLFAECVYGYAALAFVLRGVASSLPHVRRWAAQARQKGDREFYCFFPTQSFAVKRS